MACSEYSTNSKLQLPSLFEHLYKTLNDLSDRTTYGDLHWLPHLPGNVPGAINGYIEACRHSLQQIEVLLKSNP